MDKSEKELLELYLKVEPIIEKLIECGYNDAEKNLKPHCVSVIVAPRKNRTTYFNSFEITDRING